MPGQIARLFLLTLGAAVTFSQQLNTGQDYEVADIDCAIVQGGKLELLTAKLRKPEGFRGMPIFADDRGSNEKVSLNNLLTLGHGLDGLGPLSRGGGGPGDTNPCQIYPDPGDSTGRVYLLRITDFSQCGVLKRNGFVHVRVWFPQLPGVVMLSDQEVIIMCKPPQPTITQSKAAGFASSIPTGARVSGVVEESPGRLEYEVALFRETNPNTGGRSVPNGGTFITGNDAHELPVDQAVPIGTKLQLRARINPDSAWQHAKLMEVSVSPDPKNPNADGAVALIRDGCRNPELVSIIPKQPYRYKERTNEVVLDFEAFLLSNMGERNTLWLHTQIKACMESQDCNPVRDFFSTLSQLESISPNDQPEDFCMDVYQPSGYGRRRRRRDVSATSVTSSSSSVQMGANESTSIEFSSPLSKHWQTVDNSGGGSTGGDSEEYHFALPRNKMKQAAHSDQVREKEVNSGKTGSTNFGDEIGFSVIMPAEYYRSSQVTDQPFECQGWVMATVFALLMTCIGGIFSCILTYKLRSNYRDKEKSLNYSFANPVIIPNSSTRIPNHDPSGGVSSHSQRHSRDLYRP